MIRKLIDGLKLMSKSHQDAKLGRKFVGQDKLGNSFYIYYDHNQNQLKRACERDDNKQISIDPLWEPWMKGTQQEPYTQEQIEEIERKQELVKEQIRQYDFEEDNKMKAFREQQQQISREEKFRSEKWNPKK